LLGWDIFGEASANYLLRCLIVRKVARGCLLIRKIFHRKSNEESVSFYPMGSQGMPETIMDLQP